MIYIVASKSLHYKATIHKFVISNLLWYAYVIHI